MGYNRLDWPYIAAYIRSAIEKEDFVFCFDNASRAPEIFYSAYVRSGNAPHTSVINVLQRIYNGRSEPIADLVLCHVGEDSPTEMCQGMLRFLNLESQKVIPHTMNSARRYSLVKAEPRQRGLDEYKTFSVGPSPAVNLRIEGLAIRNVHRLYMMATFALTEARLRGEVGEGFRMDQIGHGCAIGAVLVSPDGEVLGWGRNTKRSNYTFHAEVNVVQSYYSHYQKPIPDHSRLYTTLKPCCMCAAMLFACTETPGTIRVFYGQNDPGGHAKDTLLDHGLCVRQLGDNPVTHKPLRTYNTTDVYRHDESDRKAPDLAIALGDAYELYHNRYPAQYVVSFLGLGDTTEIMTDARRALWRKGLKYAGREAEEVTFSQLGVLRVLHQLKPFLVSCGMNDWRGLEFPAVPSLQDLELEDWDEWQMARNGEFESSDQWRDFKGFHRNVLEPIMRRPERNTCGSKRKGTEKADNRKNDPGQRKGEPPPKTFRKAPPGHE